MKYLFALVFFSMFSCLGCSFEKTKDLQALGTREFSQEAWAKAPQEERGAMVFSLIQTYDLKKMKVEELAALLGDSTAYYEYDEFPAYLVGPKSIKSPYGDGYLLAFPFDRKTGFIIDYIILPKL